MKISGPDQPGFLKLLQNERVGDEAVERPLDRGGPFRRRQIMAHVHAATAPRVLVESRNLQNQFHFIPDPFSVQCFFDFNHVSLYSFFHALPVDANNFYGS